MTSLPPTEYFSAHYAADFAVFGSNAMCGFSLGDSLMPGKRSQFMGIAEFVICQFQLNLLNQAINTYSGQVYSAWRAFSVPFADTHLCFLGHGMANHLPPSILRFAQEPWGRPDVEPVTLTWDVLTDYTRFFLGDYLEQFRVSEGGSGWSRGAFIEVVSNDWDCSACLKTAQGWESKHVTALLTPLSP